MPDRYRNRGGIYRAWRRAALCAAQSGRVLTNAKRQRRSRKASAQPLLHRHSCKAPRNGAHKWHELFDARKKAEKALLENIKQGDQRLIISGTRPNEQTDENTIRGECLTALLLGRIRDAQLTDGVLRIGGAYFSGDFYMHGETLPLGLSLGSCLFERALILDSCRIPLLSLIDTQLPALNLHRLRCASSVLLGEGFTLEGDLDLASAKIKGQLSFQGAKFPNPKTLIDAQQMRIAGSFIWRKIAAENLILGLNSSHVAQLVDLPEAWENVGYINLAGFKYERISAVGDVSDRLAWLDKHDKMLESHGLRFTPEPYVQLATVPRKQGYANDAATVMVEREKRQRRAETKLINGRLNGDWGVCFASLLHDIRRFFGMIFGLLIGYGHKPARAFSWVLGLIGFTWFASYHIWAAGHFAPSDPVVLVSSDWLTSIAHMVDQDWAGQIATWEASPSGQDYESFSPFLYAVDLFVPLDALGQERAWAPSKARGVWGWLGFYGRWLIQMAGWVITAMAAAVVTGLIGRRD